MIVEQVTATGTAELSCYNVIKNIWVALNLTSAELLGMYQEVSTTWGKEDGKYLPVNKAEEQGCAEAKGYRFMLSNARRDYVLEGKRGEIKPKHVNGEPVKRVKGEGGNGSNATKIELSKVADTINTVIDQFRAKGELTKNGYAVAKSIAASLKVGIKNVKFAKAS